jgi:hypothetical protein
MIITSLGGFDQNPSKDNQGLLASALLKTFPRKHQVESLIKNNDQ